MRTTNGLLEFLSLLSGNDDPKQLYERAQHRERIATIEKAGAERGRREGLIEVAKIEADADQPHAPTNAVDVTSHPVPEVPAADFDDDIVADVRGVN